MGSGREFSVRRRGVGKTIKGYKGVEGVRGKDGSWGERELRRGQGNE